MYPAIDIIGYYGPVILFGLTFYCLIERTPYLIVFTLGSILNTFLNTFLKSIFREPRPKNQIPFIEYEDLVYVQQYGFPSGHAQTAFFSLAFLFFANGPIGVVYCMSFLAVITLYQRWKYRRHDLKQLVFGSLIGATFAWILVFITQQYLYKNNSFMVL
jgi:membrane-associated phospholipid phosphatase